jgi:hypothetical protein
LYLSNSACRCFEHQLHLLCSRFRISWTSTTTTRGILCALAVRLLLMHLRFVKVLGPEKGLSPFWISALALSDWPISEPCLISVGITAYFGKTWVVFGW